MGFLFFLLWLGIVLLVISGLVFAAALVHKDFTTDEEFTPVDELLEK